MKTQIIVIMQMQMMMVDSWYWWYQNPYHGTKKYQHKIYQHMAGALFGSNGSTDHSAIVFVVVFATIADVVVGCESFSRAEGLHGTTAGAE